MKGIQPMPPSLRQIFRFGCRTNCPLKSQSVRQNIAEVGASANVMTYGAPAEVCGSTDDEPMCMQIGSPASEAAANTGSQK